MARLGGYLLMFGVGSAILHFFNREFAVLMWVDNWGAAAGWAIRVAMVVVGALLMVAAHQPAERADAGQNPIIR